MKVRHLAFSLAFRRLAATRGSAFFGPAALLPMLVVLFSAVTGGHSAQGATDSWIGASGGDWSTTANWSTTKPGSADTALFNTPLASVLNASGTDQSVGSISFDANAGTGSGSFTIGAAGGNKLILANAGTVQILSTLQGTGKAIAINSSLVLTPATPTTAGTYSFSNNSSDPTNTLNFGGPLMGGTTSSSVTLTLNGANTGNNAIGGNISNGAANTVALSKSGAGMWVLSGNNSYTGATTISAGTLVLASTNSGTGGVTLTSGALDVNNANALGASGGTFAITAGTIDNTSGNTIVNAAANPITLGGSFTFSTPAGTASNNLNLGVGPVSLNVSGKTITLNGAGALSFGGAMTNTVAGVNTLTVNNGTGTTSTSAVNFGGYALSNGATSYVDIINGSGNVNITGPVTNGGSATASGLTYNGTGKLTLSGNSTYGGLTTMNNAAGTLVLAGSNSGTGGVTLTAGVLDVNNTNALGASGGTFTMTAGTIDNTSGNTIVNAIANPITLGGNFAFSTPAGTASNNLNLGAGAVNNTGNRTITINGAGQLTFGGTMTNMAAGVNTLTVNNGTGTTAASAVSFGAYALSNGTVNDVDTINGSGNVSITGPVTNGAGGSTASGLTYNGAGKLTLSGNNTYGGLTTVTTGILQLGVGGRINSGNNLTTSAGGTFDINGNAQTLGLLNTSGTVTNSNVTAGTLTIGNGSTGAGVFTGAMNVIWNQGAANTSLTGATGFTNSGNLTLNANGNGTVGVTNANNIGAVFNSGSGTGTTTITTVGSNVTSLTESSSSSALTVTTLNVDVAGTTLTNNGGTKLLTVTNSIVGTGNLVLNNNSSTTGGVTLSGGANNFGSITNSGAGSGSTTISGVIGPNVTSLVQSSSSSMLTLSNSNAFSGGLTIKAGTVQIATNWYENALGSGTFTLGDSANTGAAATIQFNLVNPPAVTFPNAVNVMGNGPDLLYTTNWYPVFAGPVTLYNNLTIGANGTGSYADTTFSGGISGTGNITVSLANVGTGDYVTFATTAVNNSGTLTFNNAQVGGVSSGTVTSANTISGGVGPNVTTITQASNYNPLNITTSPITVNGSVGTTLTSSGSALTVSGGVNGTGNLILANNSSGTAGLTISTTTVNNAGTITLTGTSTTATTLISGGIGSNVGNLTNNSANIVNVTTTALSNSGAITNAGTSSNPMTISAIIAGQAASVVQNSGSSQLILSAANTYTGDTIVSAGTLALANANAVKDSVVNLEGGNLSFGALTSGSLGGLAGTGNLNLANTAAATVALTIGNSNVSDGSLSNPNTLNPTYSGVLSGPGSVIKVGGNTQIFSGANTYTGATTVSAGTLQLNLSPATANVLLSTGTFTLGGGALSVQGNSSSGTAATQTVGQLALTNNTFSQILLGDTGSTPGTSLSVTNGSLTPAQGTMLYVNEANGGNLTLGTTPVAANSAWAVVTDSAATGFGSINGSSQLVRNTNTTVLSSTSNASTTDFTTNPSTDIGGNYYNNSGGTLTLPSGALAADSLFITAAAPAGTLALNGTLSLTGNALGMAGSGNYTISGSGQLGASPNALTVTQVGGGTLAINVPVSGGNGTFTQVGNGLVVLGASNSYTGLTSVNGGTVQLGAGGSISSGNNLTTNAVGTFDINGNAQILGNLTNNGLVTNSGTATTLTVNNGSNGSGNFSGAMNVIWNQGTGITLYGNWSNTGSITFSTTGTGLLVVNGNVNNVGNITLNPGPGAITFNGTTTSVNNLGSITSSGTGAGTVTLTAPIGSNVTSVTQNSPNSTMVLNSAGNTFGGGVAIKSGTLSVGNAASFGSGTVTLGDPANTSAAAVLEVYTVGATYPNALTVTGTGSDVLIVTRYDGIFSGPVTLNNNLTLAIANSSLGGSYATFTGGISGTGNITASLDYSTTNSYVSFTTSPVNNAGSLTFNNASVLGCPAGSGTGTNTITGGVGSNVTSITQACNTNPLTISTNPLTVNGNGTTLTASGSALFTVSGGVNGTGNLVLNNSTANAGVFSISSTAAINNAGLVVNSGSGAGVTIGAVIGVNVMGVTQSSATSPLTLAGANTYTGPTTINAGTLALGASGSINSSSGIAIAGGATFDVSAITGSGYTLRQSISATGTGIAYVNGSVLAGSNCLNLQDGTNLGTLAFNNNLTLGGGTLTFDLGSAGSDEITIAGSASFSGTDIINVAALGSVTSLAGPYTLINAAGGGLVYNDFTLSSNTLSLNNRVYDLNLSGGSGSLVLSATAASSGIWNLGSGSGTSWQTAANWTGTIPASSGTASFTGNPSGPITVTLDGAASAGALVFSTSGTSGYTLSLGSVSTGGLTLGTPGAGASIAVLSGTHSIQAPVVLAENLTVTGSGTLAFGSSSSIAETGGSQSLTMDGPGGTLILSGSDGYSDGTIVEAGTLIATNSNAIPTGTSLTVGAGGTFIFDPSQAAGALAASDDSSSASRGETVAAVPEPGTLTLLLAGLLMGFGVSQRKKRTRRDFA